MSHCDHSPASASAELGLKSFRLSIWLDDTGRASGISEPSELDFSQAPPDVQAVTILQACPASMWYGEMSSVSVKSTTILSGDVPHAMTDTCSIHYTINTMMVCMV